MNRSTARQNQSSHLIVPNILHYVWLNTGDIQYWTAINTMASIFVIKPEVVWMHCKVSPSGPNWFKTDKFHNLLQCVCGTAFRAIPDTNIQHYSEASGASI